MERCEESVPVAVVIDLALPDQSDVRVGVIGVGGAEQPVRRRRQRAELARAIALRVGCFGSVEQRQQPLRRPAQRGPEAGLVTNQEQVLRGQDLSRGG